MSLDKYKDVILNVFATLLVLTILLFLYKQVNPYFSPGLEYRMLWATCIFGFLTLISYFPEISRIFSSKVFKRTQEFLTNTRERLENVFSFERRHEYKRLIREKFIEHGYKKAWAQDLEQLSKKMVLSLSQAKKLILANKLRFLGVFVSAFIVYLLIVWLVSLKLSLEEYAFFVMLAYIPISLKLNLDSRLPIIPALFLLSLCPILLIQNFEDHANRIAIFAFYFLVIGVFLALIEHLRSGGENDGKD